MNDAGGRNSDQEHPSWATPPPFIPSPVVANIQLSVSTPAPLDATEEGTRVSGVKNASPQLRTERHLGGWTSGNLETTSFAESRAHDLLTSDVVTRNHKSTQGYESTADWETSTSQSMTNESCTIGDSHTITPPVQVTSSYMDGVFTMDMDMDMGRTPRAVASCIFEPYGDISNNFAISLPASTPAADRKNTIKRGHYKNRSSGEPTVVVESSMAGGEQGFSFKKWKIGAPNGGRADPGNREEKLVWSNSLSDDSENASITGISGFSGAPDEDPVEMTSPVQVTSNFVSVLSQQIVNGGEQDSRSQLSSSSDGIEIQPRSLNGGNFGIGQVSSAGFSDDLAFASDGVEALNIRARQESEVDGRVSRFSSRDEEIDLIQISTPASTSQLSVADITSEADALTGKNCCSPGQCLSPIAELSSRDSLEDIGASSSEVSLDNHSPSSRRVPIVIGLLTPTIAERKAN